MASESVAVETRPADVGLKRELGLIGATWASETSIIGSGWLFAPLTAVLLIGGGAWLAWIVAAIIVIVLALSHAELGAMYPVPGGTARFPHFAFGSVAGIGFGFFSYMQAVTIAPIECFAFMQYASYYWPSIYDPVKGNVTGTGRCRRMCSARTGASESAGGRSWLLPFLSSRLKNCGAYRFRARP